MAFVGPEFIVALKFVFEFLLVPREILDLEVKVHHFIVVLILVVFCKSWGFLLRGFPFGTEFSGAMIWLVWEVLFWFLDGEAFGLLLASFK